MGVDGVHYCIAPRDGDLTLENSPIYRISPMDFSEGTIIWTSKNFYDFIGISIELKDFWVLPCLIGTCEEEFRDNIEAINYEFDSKEDSERIMILDNLETLKKNFNPIKTKNIYDYIQTAYYDDDNHVMLKFSTSNIVETKRGFYHYRMI